MNPRLTRGIYLRGKFYWFAIQKDRKRHFIPLKTSDLAEAIRKVARLRHGPEITSGAVVEHSVLRFVAYMRARDERGEKGGWAKATAASKVYVLKAFASVFGKALPAQIGPEDVRRWYNERVQESSATTAFGNLMTVRSYFNWCRDVDKSVRDNPCVALRIHAPHGSARKDFCSAELVAKLIAECPREDLRFILFCGFHAGLRALEITEAVPWWFDLDNGHLHLRKTPTIQFKDREERSVPLTGQFIAFLRDYGLREPYMLHPENTHGRNRYRYDFTRPFRLYMREQSCEWVTPHTMRHTFASLLASADHSIFKIATYLGDEVRVVQKHYAKLLPEAGALDAAFMPRVPSIDPKRRRSRSDRNG